MKIYHDSFVHVKINVFSDVIPYSLVDWKQCFGGTRWKWTLIWAPRDIRYGNGPFHSSLSCHKMEIESWERIPVIKDSIVSLKRAFLSLNSISLLWRKTCAHEKGCFPACHSHWIRLCFQIPCCGSEWPPVLQSACIVMTVPPECRYPPMRLHGIITHPCICY
jgi:hypothetical protein